MSRTFESIAQEYEESATMMQYYTKHDVGDACLGNFHYMYYLIYSDIWGGW